MLNAASATFSTARYRTRAQRGDRHDQPAAGHDGDVDQRAGDGDPAEQPQRDGLHLVAEGSRRHGVTELVEGHAGKQRNCRAQPQHPRSLTGGQRLGVDPRAEPVVEQLDDLAELGTHSHANTGRTSRTVTSSRNGTPASVPTRF